MRKTETLVISIKRLFDVLLKMLLTINDEMSRINVKITLLPESEINLRHKKLCKSDEDSPS